MNVGITIDSRVWLKLPPDVDKKLLPLFEHINSHHMRLRAMGYYPGKNEPRVIKTWQREANGTHSFPRGGLSRVREVLKEEGFSWTISDQRVEGTEELDVTYQAPEGCEVAPFQTEAVEKLTLKQNAILRAPTGSRKTSTAMMIAAKNGVTTLVLVDDTGLQEQWIERASELGLSENEVGKIGGGVFQLRPLTIGLIPSIISKAKNPKDRERMLRYFGQVILDEAHGAAANRAYEAVNMFPAKHRYAISADIARKDGKEFLTYDLFGSVAFEIDREELVRQGIILDVEIRVIETAFEAPWYGGGDGEIDFNKLLDEMQVDDGRNAMIYEAVMEEVAAGEQVVILAHRRDHCRIIDSGLAARGMMSGFLIGGDDFAAQYDETKAKLRSGEARVGIGTMKAIGQGIDMPSVGVGILATPVAANRLRLNQARGRFCRKPEGRTRAVLYYLADTNIYPHHLKNLVAWNPTVTVKEDGRWIKLTDSRLWSRVGKLGGKGSKRTGFG